MVYNLWIYVPPAANLNESISDANQKLDEVDTLNANIEENILNMEAINQTLEDTVTGLNNLNSSMSKFSIIRSNFPLVYIVLLLFCSSDLKYQKMEVRLNFFLSLLYFTFHCLVNSKILKLHLV